jgi:hypothetical protein
VIWSAAERGFTATGQKVGWAFGGRLEPAAAGRSGRSAARFVVALIFSS